MPLCSKKWAVCTICIDLIWFISAPAVCHTISLHVTLLHGLHHHVIIFPLISPFMTWHRPGVYWTEFEKTLSIPCCKVWWGMQGSKRSSLASSKKLESHFWPSNRMSGWWRLSCGCTIEYPTGSTNKLTQRPIWAQMLTDSTDPTNPTNIEPRTKTTWC